MVRRSYVLHRAPPLPLSLFVLIFTALSTFPAHLHPVEDGGPQSVEGRLDSNEPSTDSDVPSGGPNDVIHILPPAEKSDRDPKKFLETLCLALGREAAANDLPAEFFTRLIWQESRFNPRARSYKGAEGIAQFMPGTARWRGLADAYEPFQALRESARWLAELREQFGNLGLAAAAYNAGPGRIQNWLSGRGALPGETRQYVQIITGRSAEEWSQPGATDDAGRAMKIVPCSDIAKLVAPSGSRPQKDARAMETGETSVSDPWGLQLTGHWSENRALAEYRDLQKRFSAVLGDKQPLVLRGQLAGRGSAPWYRVRVAERTRERAMVLCNRLKAAGGMCLVFKN